MNTKVHSSLMDENILTKKNMSIDLKVLLQNAIPLRNSTFCMTYFSLQNEMFSKLIEIYLTQPSECLFIVTMQITTETVHIGWIQSGQFGNVFFQTWPLTSPSPGAPVISSGNWIPGPRITIRSRLSHPHKYWSSRGRWLDRRLISTD